MKVVISSLALFAVAAAGCSNTPTESEPNTPQEPSTSIEVTTPSTSIEVTTPSTSIERDGAPAPGGLDGPVIFVDEVRGSDAQTAEIPGELILERNCLFVGGPTGQRTAIVWFHEARWSPDTSSILVDGVQRASVGEMFSGGGGVHRLPHFSALMPPAAFDALSQCLEEPGDQVVFVQELI